MYTGTALDEALRQQGVTPDFEGPWDYAHRSADETDIYFVAGSGSADCTFRVGGREPELFCPESGGIRDAIHYRATGDGRTIVPIRLPENGAVFVVFRRPAEAVHIASLGESANGLEIEGRIAGGCRVTRWHGAEYVLDTSQDKRVTIPPATLPAPRTIAGPWQVRFSPGWGAPRRPFSTSSLPGMSTPTQASGFSRARPCIATRFCWTNGRRPTPCGCGWAR